MNILKEKIKEGEIKLTISLDKEDLKEYIEEAEEEVVNSAEIKGFRRGKAPKDIVVKKIGEIKIREIAMEKAIHGSFSNAIEKEELDFIQTLNLNVVENGPDSLKYEASVLVFPDIELGDYENIEIEAKTIKVEEKDINEAIEYIKKSRTKFKDVDRDSQKGDRVEISFEVRHKDEIIEGGKSDNHPLILGEGKFIPGFEDEILGLKIGEAKEFSLEVPKDYHFKPIAGEKIDVKTTLNKIQEVILPEINDDFVKSLGNFSSVKELEENIKKGLTQEKEIKEKERQRGVLIELIVERSKVTVPDALIERQLDMMLQSFDQNLHRQGLELSLYLAQLKKSQEDLKKDWRDQAEKQVKASLVLRAIRQKENILVDESELKEAMSGVLGQYPNLAEAEKEIDFARFQDQIKEDLLQKKIFEFMEKKAKIKEEKSK